MPPIPPDQAARIAEIRDLHWQGLDDALDVLDERIAERARIAMRRIKRSGYKKSVIKRETKRMTAFTNSQTMAALAEQVTAAALYAQRAADVVRAWEIAGRLKDGVEHLSVSDSALERARRHGVASVDAEAALSRIKTSRLRTPREQRKALDEFGSGQPRATYTGPKTSGTRAMDKLRKVGLVRKSSEIGLSERLHGSAARNVKETEKAVSTAIREASNMNKAGRDLVSALNSEGTPLAVNQRLTKPLRRLRQAARKLQALSVNQGDDVALKEATKEFQKSFKEIQKITAQRVDARAGYLELQQKLDVKEQLRLQAKAAKKAGRDPQAFRILKVRKAEYEAATKKQIDKWVAKEQARRTDAALDRWLSEKQRYNAERITETETSGAYRAREAAQHANKPYITGFWWRRSAGAVLPTRIKKRVKVTRRSGRGAKGRVKKKRPQPCRVCPVLADTFMPVEYAKEYPRGAHPFAGAGTNGCMITAS
jgi:hypothetical protein